jgi:hypothetical protein
MVDIGGGEPGLVNIPLEAGTGAGVIRHDRDDGDFVTLMAGNNGGNFSSTPSTWSAPNDDFGALDVAVLAPHGKLVVAEEWSGHGRMFPIGNPAAATASPASGYRKGPCPCARRSWHGPLSRLATRHDHNRNPLFLRERVGVRGLES